MTTKTTINKESPYCDGCATIPCPLQNEKNDMPTGLKITSCSNWSPKNDY